MEGCFLVSVYMCVCALVCVRVRMRVCTCMCVYQCFPEEGYQMFLPPLIS